jgi:hypothetical protein
VDVFKALLAARIGLGDAGHVVDKLIRCHGLLSCREIGLAEVIPEGTNGGNAVGEGRASAHNKIISLIPMNDSLAPFRGEAQSRRPVGAGRAGGTPWA